MEKEWHGNKKKGYEFTPPLPRPMAIFSCITFPAQGQYPLDDIKVPPPPPQWRDPCYTIVLMWTKLETHMVEVHILYYFLDVRALKLLEMGVTSFQRVERLDFSELSIRISLKKGLEAV